MELVRKSWISTHQLNKIKCFYVNKDTIINNLPAAGDNYIEVPWTKDLEQAAYDEQHRALFPLSENMAASIFSSTADLSQDQRQSFDLYHDT